MYKFWDVLLSPFPTPRILPKQYNQTFPNKFQEKMTANEASNWEGVFIFMHHSSSWNHLPQLPEDVQTIIYGLAINDLHNKLWCENCMQPVLKSKKAQLIQQIPYTHINDSFVCLDCLRFKET